MTNDANEFELSRRKILAGLGTVGVASAGAGLGTSAYFSDTESLDNNRLVAGELDLQVDWEEHYYNGDAPPDNGESIGSLRLVEGAADVMMGEVGLPDPADPVVAVAAEDLADFMSDSTTETSGPTDNPPDGIVELDDVKPGDFGEITLSYHLSGNPGYVRLLGEELADDENGQPEPEAEVETSTGAGNGELGEKVQAVLWADPNCDNLLDRDSESVLKRGTLTEVISGLEMLLDPTQTGGRVAEGYDGDCHGPISTPDDVPFTCTERLFLTNTVDDPDENPSDNEPFGSPSDDETILYEVTIDSSGDAQLNELFNLNTGITGGPNGGSDYNDDGVGDYNHVVSMAAGPSGETIYLIDKFSKRLGKYDLASDSFTDCGEISGAPNQSLQAAVAPDGKLYFTAFGESDLYVINDPDTSSTVDSTIPLTDQNGDSIEVGGSDIAFLSNGTLFLFDGNVSDSTDDLYKLTDPATGNAEFVNDLPADVSLPGLAVRAAGDGNLIGVDSENDKLYEIDPSDGSMVETYPITDPSGFDHQFGDMTVGALCPEQCVALAWWVPRDVGNEIQTDSYKFNLTFETEQCRHNETPFDDGSGQPTDESGGGTDTDGTGTDSFAYTFDSNDDVTGSSLNGIELTYPNGTSAVSNASIQSVALGGTDVSGDVDSQTTSNNGGTLTIEFGGSNNISDGDKLSLTLANVSEPSGSYDVNVVVNPQSGGTSFTRSF